SVRLMGGAGQGRTARHARAEGPSPSQSRPHVAQDSTGKPILPQTEQPKHTKTSQDESLASSRSLLAPDRRCEPLDANLTPPLQVSTTAQSHGAPTIRAHRARQPARLQR